MLNQKETDDFYIKNSANTNGEIDFESLSTPNDELDGIDVLYQMARQGKINPWNIDIADIADKYMLHIAENKSNNLRLSSRAWLFLAILLKLKSNVLVGIEELIQPSVEEEQPVEEFFDDDTPGLDYNNYYGDNVIPEYSNLLSVKPLLRRSGPSGKKLSASLQTRLICRAFIPKVLRRPPTLPEKRSEKYIKNSDLWRSRSYDTCYQSSCLFRYALIQCAHAGSHKALQA